MVSGLRMVASVVILFGISNAIEIVNLPGQPPSDFKQYSGFYAVGENSYHNLHYWFVESQNNPATDPVLLWLSGGPGCSGLFALLQEWGPFLVNSDGATLRVNPYSWNSNASILVLEAPTGAGYSYSTNGNIINGDSQTAEENWEALVAFFNEFPQFKNNDFYVTGESYGGVFVPTLVQQILDNQQNSFINVKGFAIGNGCVSNNENTDSLVNFLYGHGLVDETLWKKVESECCDNDANDCPFHSFNQSDFCGDFVQSTIENARCDGLNPYNLYSDCGDSSGANKRTKRSTNRIYDSHLRRKRAVTCLDFSALTTYLNRQDVRKALGIPSALEKWSICSEELGQLYNKEVTDTSCHFKKAIDAGLKVMLYSGDVDMDCNFLMGQRFSQKLGFPLSAAKKKYLVDGQVGGFHTKYSNNLDFDTVRGAGTLVPSEKPHVAHYIINTWLNNQNF